MLLEKWQMNNSLLVLFTTNSKVYHWLNTKYHLLTSHGRETSCEKRNVHHSLSISQLKLITGDIISSDFIVQPKQWNIYDYTITSQTHEWSVQWHIHTHTENIASCLNKRQHRNSGCKDVSRLQLA